MDKSIFVLDGGFFPESNILELIHANMKFLMQGQLDGKWIFSELESAVPEMEKTSNIYSEDRGCTVSPEGLATFFQ